MYAVEVEHFGEINGKTGLTKEKAIEIAENAVYEYGADWACVYDENMGIYAEYEI